MKLIDTHCHLYSKEFDGDQEEMLQRADKEGVERFYLPMVDRSSREALLTLEAKHPGICLGMTGLHPTSVKADWKEELRLVEADLGERSWAAVGEIGLDFYWDRSFERQQYEAFHLQIEWALSHGLPVVIHSRDSMKEAIGVVKEHQNGTLRGIFHCFGGSIEEANEIIGLGFYLGIGGVVTYKNSGLAAVLVQVGLEHVVLETDAPYLAPVPFRGKRNESAYLRFIVEKIATIMEVPWDRVAAMTTANAQKIFGG